MPNTRRPSRASRTSPQSGWYPRYTSYIPWTPYVFVRLVAFLIAGIGWSLAALPFQETAGRWLLLGLLSLYLILYGLQRTLWVGRRLGTLSGLLAFGILFLVGALLTQEATATREPAHLIRYESGISYFSGTIVSGVQERPNTYKVELAVSQVRVQDQWQSATGKVLTYLPKTGTPPQYGDVLLIKGAPRRVPPPANPGEFDYRSYLAIGQIHHQSFVKEKAFVVLAHQTPNRVFAASLRVRQWADGVFRKCIASPEEYAIATGLVLGIREALGEELKSAYASAGAMHVLAVSGAHVVIVFWIITQLLGKLKKIPYGKFLFAAVSLILLWFYAFVTGLSASVLRAVVMFSFVIMAEVLNREKSSYNFIAASAFFLLCWNPYLLLDVGFQLSYVAILGLVYVQPKIYHWFDFHNPILDKVWGMSAACLAAQLAVLPFSLFYFHQFPLYFLLANLVVIPLSSLVLYAGIALLAVSAVPYVGSAVGWLLSQTIWLLNQTAFITQKLPYALLDGFALTGYGFALLLGLLVFTLIFIQYKKLWHVAIIGLLLTGLVTLHTLEEKHQQQQRRLALYAVNGFSTCDIIEGKTHLFVADSALLHNNSKIRFHLLNDWWQHGVTKHTYTNFTSVPSNMQAWHHREDFSLLVWGGKRFIFLHQYLPEEQLRQMHADYLIIQHNALRRLDGLSQNIGQIIIDSSNKYYLGKRLKTQADAAGIACHWMAEAGAWVWEVE